MNIEPLRPPHQDELLLRHLRALLGDADPALVDALRTRLQWIELDGGEVLMRQGDPGDSLYLLVSGRLRVYMDDGHGERMVREIARGEVVGEMSLYTGAPRTATLVAIRDSVLVRLTKADFDAVLARHAELSVALTRQIIRRLQTEHATTLLDRPVTMALMPVSGGVDAAGFAARLAAALARFGRVAVVDAARVDAELTEPGLAAHAAVDAPTSRRVALLLDEVEAAHEFVLLVGDDDATPWTHCCARHADELLLLADAGAAPVLHPIEARLLVNRPRHAEAAQILVLLHPAEARAPRGTAAWLDRRPLTDHVHVRAGHDGDMARLARLQSRNAVGLVLAGGGARGFAHLGVWRALVEHGIDIDCVGGTSIGAVMATYVASDRTFEVIDANARHAFKRKPTGDFNLVPLLSLLRGRRLRAVLQQAVDNLLGRGAGMEDLWKSCFCVATNYSRAREEVLRRGSAVKCLLASISIPGALPPVVHNGDLLCDGGTFNNFPADVMARMRGVGTVIGVDLAAFKPRRLEFDEVPGTLALLRDRLRPRARRRYRLPTLAAYLINVTILYSTSRRREAREATQIYFNPPLERVGLLEWNRYEQIVQQGYRHAQEVLRRTAPP